MKVIVVVPTRPREGNRDPEPFVTSQRWKAVAAETAEHQDETHTSSMRNIGSIDDRCEMDNFQERRSGEWFERMSNVELDRSTIDYRWAFHLPFSAHSPRASLELPRVDRLVCSRYDSLTSTTTAILLYLCVVRAGPGPVTNGMRERRETPIARDRDILS